MDGHESSAEGILAMLLPLKDRVGLIPLSDRFEFSLTPWSEVRTADEHVLLAIAPLEASAAGNTKASVASLTVLYGENGWGKTHLMLEACKTLSNVKGERRIALIFALQGVLYLDPGSILKRRIRAVFNGRELDVRSVDQEFGTAFYSTSPFEATKRRALRAERFFDVTPSFSPTNPFEGGALIRSFANLPKDFEFIKIAEVRMNRRIPSLRSVLEKILPYLKHKNPELPYLRRSIARLDQLLNEHAQRALAVALLIAMQDGIRLAADILLRLAHRINLFNERHGRAVIDEEAKQQATEVVIHYLATDDNMGVLDFQDPLTLYHFINVDLPMRMFSLGRPTKLGELAELFNHFSARDWDYLHQVTRLGLVTWSFRNLSSGQVAFLMLFSSLANAMTRLQAGRTAFLFIDEGEMFMHPAWQRRYITDLLTFLGKYPEVSSRLHVVLSTHSLIVAADAPPNRLFNVKSGEMVNGFGYGPKDMLDHIYGVREFQGEHAGRLMESLVEHLRNRNLGSMRAEEALELASNIADDRLRKYLTNELSRRSEAGGNLD
ncbi:AAA family ATPase [Comamonas terrigena]|uniref:AAA family ATPase n=1 Tax=Comamonas terrigena TaxID=32013 RepID=UPI0028A17D89|nr:AAA family ATPase [Comamonas terrigena]